MLLHTRVTRANFEAEEAKWLILESVKNENKPINSLKIFKQIRLIIIPQLSTKITGIHFGLFNISSSRAQT